MHPIQVNPLFVAKMKARDIERLDAKWPLWIPLWGKRILDRIDSYLHRKFNDAAILIVEYLLQPLWNRFFSHRFWIKLAIDPEPGIAACRFIREHTSIPVPRPWFTLRYRGAAYICMDRVPGVSLEHVFLDLTDAERTGYVEQLAGMLSELRALQSPYGSQICSANGGYVNMKSVLGPSRMGPFCDEDAFNNASLDRIWPQKVRSDHPLPPPDAFCHDISHPIVFTHGDIAPRNIMVKDGQITGIIDWETAGWFPAYWEFVEMHDSNGEWRGDPVSEAFRPYIPRLLPSYQKEMDARTKWGAF